MGGLVRQRNGLIAPGRWRARPRSNEEDSPEAGGFGGCAIHVRKFASSGNPGTGFAWFDQDHIDTGTSDVQQASLIVAMVEADELSSTTRHAGRPLAKSRRHLARGQLSVHQPPGVSWCTHHRCPRGEASCRGLGPSRDRIPLLGVGVFGSGCFRDRFWECRCCWSKLSKSPRPRTVSVSSIVSPQSVIPVIEAAEESSDGHPSRDLASPSLLLPRAGSGTKSIRITFQLVASLRIRRSRLPVA